MIRSTLFNAAFWIITLFFSIICLPFELAYRPFTFNTARMWTATLLWLLKVMCGITYEVRGKEYIPQGPALVASKHQSAWDTVIFWALLKRPVFVLKRELIFIPIFGWQLLLLKSIYIDRKAGGSAIKKMMREAKARIQENAMIIIFPEGTRTAPGATSVFQPGIAALYKHLNVPVIPVALNSGLHWGKNAFIKNPGVITIEFLPPITPGLNHKEFFPLLVERIETASRALLNTSS